VIHIFTHDSIGVGEDGPTHQPVEHLISLRAIPGLITLRPGDPNEVAEAWRVIMQMKREPVCLILSRQNMPTLDRTRFGAASGVAKGAYVLADNAEGGVPEVILIGTGSEVGLCVDAWETLVAGGARARVVSMPSWELFAHQSKEYRDSVLPPSCTARISVEQASTFGWSAYATRNIGMQTFGASAPLKELQKKFGFTPDAVVAAAREEIAAARQRG
jgi:transketolase